MGKISNKELKVLSWGKSWTNSDYYSTQPSFKNETVTVQIDWYLHYIYIYIFILYTYIFVLLLWKVYTEFKPKHKHINKIKDCFLIENAPVRGIEPRPRRWERRILTTRPHGTCNKMEKDMYIFQSTAFSSLAFISM